MAYGCHPNDLDLNYHLKIITSVRRPQMFVCIFDEEKIDLLWINVCPSSMQQQVHATRKEGWWYCSLHALVKNTPKNDNFPTTISILCYTSEFCFEIKYKFMLKAKKKVHMPSD